MREERDALSALLSTLPCRVELPRLGEASSFDLPEVMLDVARALMRIDSETATRIREAAEVHLDHARDGYELCVCPDDGGIIVTVHEDGRQVITALGECLEPTEGDLRRRSRV